MRATYLLVIASMVVGCGHVPVTSLPKLSRLDMMTLDARQLRVAVDMPDGLRVQRDSAIIITGLKESPDGPAVEERFVLEEVKFTEPGGTPPEGAQVFRIPKPTCLAFRLCEISCANAIRLFRKRHADT